MSTGHAPQDAGVVVVGAGQAAASCAIALRRARFGGPVTILGDEPDLPYSRPPLSKAYLDAASDGEGVLLRPPPFWPGKGIEVRPADPVVQVDRAAHEVQCASGRRQPYSHLVLATGATARRLPVPGAGLDGVLTLRTRADADALRARLDAAARVVVVGAGFIGLELAAAAAGRGLDVTVVEALPHAMSRVVTPTTAAPVVQEHRRRGVRVLLSTTLTEVTGAGGRVTGVRTTDGAELPADLVLVGVGAVPSTSLASRCGLAVDDGVLVDDRLLTADPDVSAVGDCARYPSAHAGGALVRLEAEQNAADHGRLVAARLTGDPAPYRAVPWFWTDQYGHELKVAGLADGYDGIEVRGDPAALRFSTFCLRGGRVVAVESVDRLADHVLARRLLADPSAEVDLAAFAP